MRLSSCLQFASLRTALFVVGGGAALAACSGGAVTLSQQSAGQPTQAPFTTFIAATNTVCVTPLTSAQTVTLPPTGGVTGTIAIGAFAAAATGCEYVKISTGADAEIVSTFARLGRENRIDASTANPTPLLTISVGEGLNDNPPLFGYETIVTGMQLNTGPNVNFPDGTYYATITSPQGNISALTGTIAFTAKNGVLTVAPLTLPSGNAFPVVITANTASIITLYPRGVIPPSSTPAPSPSPTGSTSPSPSPSPSPSSSGSQTPTPEPTFATAMPNAGAYGNPPPANGSTIGSYAESGSSAYCAQYAPCSDSNVPLGQQNGGGIIYAPSGFAGTITFSADIAYMGLYPPVTNTCASDWTIDAALSGSGTIGIPDSDFVEAPGPTGAYDQPLCVITYSTLPTGGEGSYYTETLTVYPESNVVPCSNGVCDGNVRRRRRLRQ